MRSINLIATVAATATFGLAATAQADTYCVGSPSACPGDGVAMTDLKAGLEAADGHPGHDVVRLGSGPFTTPDGFAYSGGGTNTLELVGEGDATVLSADTETKAGNFKVLTVEAGAPSRIAKLRVVTPSAPDNSALPLGLSLEGDVLVESVTVTDHGNEQQSARGRAIVMDGGDSARRRPSASASSAAAPASSARRRRRSGSPARPAPTR